MKKQVLVIHGGNAFEKYEEYLSYLKNKEVTIEKITRNDWKDSLGKALGDEYQVLAPRMPNGQNARYSEWKIWFEKIVPLLDEPVILIGHSMGGIFLAKYLSENVLPKKITATFLVAAPYNAEMGESLVDFALTRDLTKLNEQVGKIFLYQSKDDPVVPFSHVEKYHKELPNATLRIFEDKQHFNQPELPELVEDIKSLSY